MEGLKFRVVEDNEEKSIQESQQIIENQLNQDDLSDDLNKGESDNQKIEVDDSYVLDYLKNRYQKEYTSLDEVVSEKQIKADLPDDVKNLMEFGVDNYIKINKDWDKESETNTLKEYYKLTKPHLDDEDIEYLLEDEFSYDEELDDDREIKKKKVALKEELSKAKEHLNGLKEQYKLESRFGSNGVPENYEEAYNFYQEYTKKAEEESKVGEEKSKAFTEKTNNLFSNDFKGFEFNLGDKKQFFKPANVEETKNLQSNLNNYIGKHLDENGVLIDAHSYHKSLAMALDPDGFAKFFYEQGKADATNDVIKNVKNIDMSIRDNKDLSSNPNKQMVRVVSDDSFDSGIKIKSNRKN